MSTKENEMLALFIQEAEEHLQTLDNDLILLESNPHDQEGINRVFRAVHSIKGTAGFFGFSGIVELAHAMENVMSLVRDGEMPVSPELINIFLAATDKLKIMVHDPDRSSEVDVNYELSSLSRMLSQEPAESKASPES
ncbi:MAG: Hpt domain-containing protein, partial [Chthoniobacterales bacterium]|nr:Hpt domain-containing protein [Chthoniobacterales bacterium]